MSLWPPENYDAWPHWKLKEDKMIDEEYLAAKDYVVPTDATISPKWEDQYGVTEVVPMKYDAGKVRYELFPGDALYGISTILTFGAKKYEDRGWEKGMEWSRVFGALMRHMWAWWGGEKLDPETEKSHLWHAGCCIVFLIAYEMRGTGKDDRP